MLNQIGQITINSNLGNIIYNLCKENYIQNIVEIGTHNGLGSTKCIYDAIIESNKHDYLVYSIESNKDYYNLAKKNLPELLNFNIILGRIIEITEIVDIDKYDDSFFYSSDRTIQKSWLEEDKINYNSISNVCNLLPSKIDLLILDGGEFSSFGEFNRLKDISNYTILDDTKSIKNFEVRNYIINSGLYNIIEDSCDRGGYMVVNKN